MSAAVFRLLICFESNFVKTRGRRWVVQGTTKHGQGKKMIEDGETSTV